MQTIQLSLFFGLVMERNDRVSLRGSDGRREKKKKQRPRNGYESKEIKSRRIDVIIFNSFHNCYENFRVISYRWAKSVKNQR